jgi:hypothetical protein
MLLTRRSILEHPRAIRDDSIDAGKSVHVVSLALRILRFGTILASRVARFLPYRAEILLKKIF